MEGHVRQRLESVFEYSRHLRTFRSL